MNLHLFLFSHTLKILVLDKISINTSLLYLEYIPLWLEKTFDMISIFSNLLRLVFSFNSHLLAFQYNLLSESWSSEVSVGSMLATICWVLIMWWENFKWLMFKWLTHLILMPTLWDGYYYYFHVTIGEAKEPRHLISSSSSHKWWMAELDFELMQLGCRVPTRSHEKPCLSEANCPRSE